jgi:hypothetical protein
VPLGKLSNDPATRPYEWTDVVFMLSGGFAVADKDIELTIPLDVSATALAVALRPLTEAAASARKPPVVVAWAIDVAAPRVPLDRLVELTPVGPVKALATAKAVLLVLEILAVALASPLLPGVPVPNVSPPPPLCALAVPMMVPPPGLLAVN